MKLSSLELCSVCAAALLAPTASAQTSLRASVTSKGVPQAIGFFSTAGGLSSDGRYVLLSSDAPNLFPNGSDGSLYNTFVHDRELGTTTLVGLSAANVEPNDSVVGTGISSDARWVVLSSYATDMVFGDTNGTNDVFLRDRLLSTTTRISVSTAGAQANSLSSGGLITPDGALVVFNSNASNLDGIDTNAAFDPFVRDIAAGTTTRLAVIPGGALPNGGSYGADVSSDGRFVLVESYASNIDPGDSDTQRDVFLVDRVLGMTAHVCVDSAGVDANNDASVGAVSDDGRYVVFSSPASNLVPLDTNAVDDIFLRDLVLGTTTMLSVGVGGFQIDHHALRPTISTDGSIVAFSSWASNLVIGDTNGMYDQFLLDRTSGSLERFSVASNGAQSSGQSMAAATFLSADGRVLSYSGAFVGVVPSQIYANDQVYVHDRNVFATVTTYCTAKVNSAGCTPYITSAGVPRASGPDVFFVVAQNVLVNKFGVLFWGHAPSSAPFGGGTLCVKTPIVRTDVQNSGSTVGLLCSGSYSFHFTQAYAQSKGIQPGDTIYGQWWSRDTGFSAPNNMGLTDAVRFAFIP